MEQKSLGIFAPRVNYQINKGKALSKQCYFYWDKIFVMLAVQAYRPLCFDFQVAIRLRAKENSFLVVDILLNKAGTFHFSIVFSIVWTTILLSEWRRTVC